MGHLLSTVGRFRASCSSSWVRRRGRPVSIRKGRRPRGCTAQNGERAIHPDRVFKIGCAPSNCIKVIQSYSHPASGVPCFSLHFLQVFLCVSADWCGACQQMKPQWLLGTFQSMDLQPPYELYLGFKVVYGMLYLFVYHQYSLVNEIGPPT